MAVHLETAINVATVNVRGLAARRKQCQLCRLFAESELDIIAVQETKVQSQEMTDRMLQPFREIFDVCVSHAVGTSAGCALFIRRSLGVVQHSVVADSYGRFVYCDFSFSDVEWRVMCIYAPNRQSEREIFFQSISKHIDCERVVVLLGDFNCVCTAEDRATHERVRDKSAECLMDIIEQNCLEDVAHCTPKSPVRFTHFQGSSHARLDRVYLHIKRPSATV